MGDQSSARDIGDPTKPETRTDEERGVVPFRKLFAFADGYDYFLMVLGTLGAVAHGLAFPLFFFLFGRLIHNLDSATKDPHMYHQVSKIALYFVFMGIVLLAASWTEIACWIQTGERQTTRLRIRYLAAILDNGVGYFDVNARTGDIVNNVSSNAVLVQQAISDKMGNIIHHLASFVGGIICGFLSAWQLGLLTLAVVPAIILLGALYAYTFTTIATRAQKAYGRAGTIIEEAVSQVRTIYSFVGEEKTKESYSDALKSTLSLGYKAGMAKGIGMGGLYAVALAAWAMLLWYGGVLVRNGTTNGGEVLSTIFCTLFGSFALGQCSPSIAALSKARAAAFQMMEVIESKSDVSRDTVDGDRLDEVRGEIELRHVSFSYPSRPETAVLTDFGLLIPAGSSIAIVGQSGSGKSTIISLIERFYDPTSGSILLDGCDIQTLQLKWLRAQLGLVNQEPVLFDASIEENILYGKEGATTEEVETAARNANAHEFISSLPDGYRTRVGTRGVQLSGGQKQRVAIARALVKSPSIVLLDEATSALDLESERLVQEALNSVMVGRTTVIVAHRLSTIQNADTIVVLEHGKLMETGSHDQLISSQGSYSKLVQLQESVVGDFSSAGRHSISSSRSHSFRGGSLDENAASGRLSISKMSFTSLEHEEDDFRQQKESVLWRLVKLNLPELPFLLLGIVGAIAAGLPSPAYSFLVSDMLKVYYTQDHERMKQDIRKYALIILLVAAGSILAFFTQHYFFGVAGERVTKRIRELMLSAILRNEVGWFDREENGSRQLTARLASDAVYLRAASGDMVAIFLQNATVIFTSFIIAFVVEWKLAILMVALFPLIAGASFLERYLIRGLSGDLAESHERASSIAGEAVSNIRTVAAFNAQDKLVKLFEQELEGPVKSSFLRGNRIGLAYGLASFFLYCSYALGLWYGGRLVKSKQADFSSVIKSFLVLIMAAFSIGESLALIPDMTGLRKAVASVFQILDRKSLIDPEVTSSRKDHGTRLRGEIEFKDVVFAYPTRPDLMIFTGMNLKVPSGRSMAIVGPSGSGKSSIIALVQRFYDPLSGAVLVDGRDIRKMNLKAYRRNLGLVEQEPALFATSIRENILYGRCDGVVSEEELVAAAVAANAHGFISSLPDGYETYVGERGVQLSGGQKQRIAIARVILKDPSVLLLDEATSALDAESERAVHEALERLVRRRTSLVVAHRLSTVRNADCIAVLHDGCIVEQGTHSQLMSRSPNGAYARLVALQQMNGSAA